MAEEISDFVSHLRIDDEEDAVIDIKTVNPNNENSVSLLLLGRLLTERSYNVDAFKRTITTVWAPKHGLVIRVLKPNLYAFQFFHWRDMTKVLEGRPWCFDNMLILLKEAEGDEQPDQVTLTHSPFWIRLKNLPLNNRSDDVVRALIGNMGEIIEIEEDVLGFGRYRRVKVMLNVSKPLRRYRKIRDKRGRELQIDFAYERLPFFCLACGVMGHSEKDCQVVLEEDKCEKLGWHLGLKATPRKGRTKEVEEELKFRNCKKVLFEEDSCVHGKRENESNVLTISSLHGKSKVVVPPGLNTDYVASEHEPDPPHVPLVAVAVEDNSINFPPVMSPKVIGDFNPLDTPPLNEGTNVSAQEQQKEVFVFSSSKKEPEVKSRGWKRLARGSMDDKGFPQHMDMDSPEKLHKRSVDQLELVSDIHDGALKRSKLSPSCDFSPIDLAVIGECQSRRSL